jgi:hypothetical protein
VCEGGAGTGAERAAPYETAFAVPANLVLR